MAYDLVTWSPRVGGSGDSKYDPPGATTLAGPVDSGNPTRIDAGPSSYSTPPTIAEINAGSGLNQVIALYNRRGLQLNTLRNSAITAPIAYLSSASPRIAATTILALYTAIGTLRAGEGFGAYTFPTAEVAAAKMILGTHLAHARKALQISGVQTINSGALFLPWWRQRDEVPYGTIQATNIYNGSIYVSSYGGRGVLQSGPSDIFFSGLATGFVRIRGIWPLPVYGFMDSSEIVSAELQVTNTTAAIGGGIGEIGLNSISKATTAVAPIATDFDDAFSVNTSYSSTGSVALSIPAAQFSATGIVRQILFVEQHELASNSAALVGASQVPPRASAGSPALPTIVINWG